MTFAAGLFIGAALGVLAMALIQFNKQGDSQ